MLDSDAYTYNYEESIIHSMNAMLKIISFILFIISCFFKFDLVLFMSSMIWVFVLMIISNVRLTKYLKVIYRYKYLLIFLYIVLRSLNMDLIYVNIIFFKVLFCLLYYYVIVFTTTKKDLSNSLGNIFSIGKLNRNISRFFFNIYYFISGFIKIINDNDEINSIKGNNINNSSMIDRYKNIVNNLPVYRDDYIKRKSILNGNIDDLLYNSSKYTLYKYKNRINIFDYILVLFFIFIYVYYVIKVR